MSSICTGQTELCQSPGQGPGVLRPASFQMVEEEDGSLQEMCPHFIQTYSSLEQVLSALSLNLGQWGSGQRKEGEKKQKVSQSPQPSGASTLLTFTAQ